MCKKVLTILFLAFWAVPAFAQNSYVNETSVPHNEQGVPVSTDIGVGFDMPMNPESVDSTTFVVNGWLTGLHPGDFEWGPDWTTVTFIPDEPFEKGELVTIVLTTGIESDDGYPLAHSYVWSFTTEVEEGPGTFPPHSAHPVGDYPVSVFVADLDKDGDLDLATANEESDSVSVLLNEGDGTFSLDTVYAVGNGPVSIFAADLDRDSCLDLATANKESDAVSVLWNNGDGTFSPDSTYSVGGDYPVSIFAADLDGDGYLDLATANERSYDVSVLLKNGDRTFGPAAVYSIGGAKFGLASPVNPKSVFAADLNGDSLLDLATANYGSGNVSVLLNNIDSVGTFEFDAVYSVGANAPYSIFAADLNRDNVLDLTTANYGDSTVSVLLNDGVGNFALPSVYPVGGENPAYVYAADLDGDGAFDLATANSSSNDVSVLFNDGEGNFDSLLVYSSGAIGPRSVFAADLDGDSVLDLVTPNSGSNDVSVLLNQTSPEIDSILPKQNQLNISRIADIWAFFSKEMDPTTINHSTFIVNGRSTGLRKGVFELDIPYESVKFDPEGYLADGELVTVVLTRGIKSYGGASLASSYTSSFTIVAHEAPGTFPLDSVYSVETDGEGVNPRSVFAADLDGDSFLDLAIANYFSDDVSVLLNNGDGSFITPPSIYSVKMDGADVGPRSVFGADFDRDGDIDLATANYFSDDVSVLLNNGDGTFITPPSVNSVKMDGEDVGPRSVFGADFDRDGDIDLATANYHSHEVSILRNDGSGNFDTLFVYSLGDLSYPTSVFAADVDRDWDPDLITANSGFDSVSVLFHNGDTALTETTFGACTSYWAGEDPKSVFVADLDGDRDLDLATANEESCNVSVMLNDGDSVFILGDVYRVGDRPVSIFAGDVDGDLDLDLTTANSGDSSVSVLLNDGYGDFDSVSTYRVYAVSPMSIFVADLDGDNDLDLTTANSGDNSVSVLLNKAIPKVDFISPAQNQLNVSIDCSISVTFNVDMNSNSFDGSTFIINARSTGRHEGDISYNGDTKTATFVPESNFEEGEVVTVVLTPGIETSEEVSLPKSYVWSFTTRVNRGLGFNPHSDYSVGAGKPKPYSVFAADLDDDEHLDLATANYDSNSVSVFLYNAVDSVFYPAVTYPIRGSSPASIFAADLDQDGDIDIVTANEGSDNVSVHCNNGDGTFGIDSIYSVVFDKPMSVFAADLDGDGDLDIATANHGHDNVSVLLNNGEFPITDTTFAFDSAYSIGGKVGPADAVDPKSVFAADLNGDHALDLVTANYGSGNVSVLLNNGNGTFAFNFAYSLEPSNPYAVFAADLDGDSALDLATANHGDTSISVLLNYGDGSFAPPSNYPVAGENPASVFAADLDGDGDLDLTTANENSHSISVLYNEGDQFVPCAHAVGKKPLCVFASDLNGDGLLDLASANSDTNNISILFTLGVFLGDCNADGIIDLEDLLYLINCLYKGGPCPDPLWIGDVNCDGIVDLGDLLYLINYLYKGGPPPGC